MSELEQVSKEMMDELEDMKKGGEGPYDILSEIAGYSVSNSYFPITNIWYGDLEKTSVEKEMAILNHVYFGNPQFEAEKTKKWIVRSINHDGNNHYKYIIYPEDSDLPIYEIDYDFVGQVVKFDTREEAEEWTNPQTEVVEVEG